MTPTPSFRDIQQLSAYLDGQLKPKESARLEARLQTDPGLASALEELRHTRSFIRQLPKRRAPRNFILTPKMVGQKPPLPRAYPVFQYSSVLATLLLFISFLANFMAPRLTPQVISGPFPYGIGGGGTETEMEIQPTQPAGELMLEAPAVEEPAEGDAAAGDRAESAEPGESAAPQAPNLALPTATPAPEPGADSLDIQPTPVPTGSAYFQAQEKTGVTDQFAGEPAEAHVPISPVWQIALAALAIISALITYFLRRNAASKWRSQK